MTTPLPRALAAMALLAPPSLAVAEILVYEPFAYHLAEEAPLRGAPVAAAGLAGKFDAKTETNLSAGSDGAGAATYSATGLEFDANFHPVSGGAAVLSATAGSAQNGLPTTQTLAAALKGSLAAPFYLSFLFKFAGDFPPHNNGSTTVRLEMGDLVVAPNMSANFRNVAGIGFAKPKGSAMPFDPFAETVFLAVAKVSTSEAGSRQASLWILDQNSFDAWTKSGAKEESLSNFAQVHAASAPEGGTADVSGKCEFKVFSGNFASHNITITVDELVVATTLRDVTTGSAGGK